MKRKSQSDTVQIPFSINALSEEIAQAAICGKSRYYQLSELVREALYDWGIIHLVREKGGGFRLKPEDGLPSPFGIGRERELISLARANYSSTTQFCRRTAAMITPVLFEVVQTAIQDPRAFGLYKTPSDVINQSIVLWGLTHLELDFTDAGWDFSRPLSLRQAFDFDSSEVSLKTASFQESEITADSNFFPKLGPDDPSCPGSVSVPFLKPAAESNYLSLVASGAQHCIVEFSSEDTSDFTQPQTKEERKAALQALLDTV